MFGTKKTGFFAAIIVILSLPGVTSAAQRHSGYQQAREDLRLARALLQRTTEAQTLNGTQDEVTIAISNIDGAIAEIDKEAPTNGKKNQSTPKIDPRLNWGKRLSMSFRMLDMAKLDCSKEKDDSADAGLKTRVLDYIDQAHDRIRVAIDTVNFDYSARNLPTRND